MSRDAFGTWGHDLDDAAFARALACWGVVQAVRSVQSMQDAGPPSSPLTGAVDAAGADPEATLTSVLQAAGRDGPELVPWHVATEPQSDPLAPSAARCAAAWEAVADRLCFRCRGAGERAIRLHVQPSPWTEPMLPWVVARLGDARPGGGTRVVATIALPPAGSTRRWRWPLRALCLDDPRSIALADAIERTHWAWRGLAVVRVADSSLPAADVLVLPWSLEESVGHVARYEPAAGVGCVVVLGGTAAPWPRVQDLVARLRDQAGADGVCVLDGFPNKVADWFNNVVEQLSHNAPLELSVLAPGAEPGRLWATHGLLRDSLLEHVAEDIAERLAALPDRALPIPNTPGGRMSPRLASERLRRELPGMPFDHESGAASWLAGLGAAVDEAESGPPIVSGHVNFRGMPGPAPQPAPPPGPPPTIEPPEPPGGEGEPQVPVERRTRSIPGRRTEALPVEEARAIRADVAVVGWQGADVPIRKSFVAGHLHRVAVWIGHQRDASATTISNRADFEEERVDRDAGSETDLDVTLAYSQQCMTSRLKLPNARSLSSQPCLFYVTIDPQMKNVNASIVVRQKGNKIIQQCVLVGPAGAAPDDIDDASIELQTEVDMSALDQPVPTQGMGAAVSGPAGNAPQLLFLADGTANVVVPWREGVRKTTDIIAEQLFNTARAVAVDPSDPSWLELVYLLAVQGTVLFSWLTDNGFGALCEHERIQLVDADPTEVLPLELVYDRGAITEDAVPCDGWAATLSAATTPGAAAAPNPIATLDATGRLRSNICAQCVLNEPAALGQASHICPLGFWGLAKVIERQTGKADPTVLGRVDPIANVLYAASDNVLDDDYERTRTVIQSVLGRPPDEANTWEEWPSLARAASLIVVLPHQGHAQRGAVDFLEIGTASRLLAGQFRSRLGKLDAAGHDPIVLLLGCKTAEGSISYQNFVAEFRSNGAAIVVGTLSTVLGRNAAPIAQDFVREIAAAAASGGDESHGFGEVMRTVRRRMVGQRNAAALGLVAFGDTDWTIQGGGG